MGDVCDNCVEVTKTDSILSGDVKEVVIMKTLPGYDGNPGHPGTGKVIAILCQQP